MTRDEIIALALETGAIFNEEHGTELAVALGRERIVGLVEAAIAQERKKHQADIEHWKGEAAKAEKWRALAMAKDGDGRAVRRIQREAVAAFIESREVVLAQARAEEREACAELAESFGPGRPLVRQDCSPTIRGRWEGEQAASSSIARIIRARGAQPPKSGSAILEALKTQQERFNLARAEHLAKGQCPDCEGEGEIGGQFCGGYQACEKCGGTGKSGGNP